MYNTYVMIPIGHAVFALSQQDPQSLYDNIDPLEPEASKSDFEGFDYSVYEVLEEENFDLWTPGASHGGMDRRTKVVKKKGKSLKQNKAHDIDNEFIVSILICSIF